MKGKIIKNLDIENMLREELEKEGYDWIITNQNYKDELYILADDFKIAEILEKTRGYDRFYIYGRKHGLLIEIRED